MGTQTKSSKLIRGSTGDWEVVIGLEVHAQVSSNAKLFSGASTAFGGAPKDVEAPENSLAFEVTCACTSMPITISQSPLAPAITFGSGSRYASSAMRSVRREAAVLAPASGRGKDATGQRDAASSVSLSANADGRASGRAAVRRIHNC